MSQDASTFILGAVILVVLIPVIYVVARVVTTIGDAGSARLLAPLAPAIGGNDLPEPPLHQRHIRDVLCAFPLRPARASDQAIAPPRSTPSTSRC